MTTNYEKYFGTPEKLLENMRFLCDPDYREDDECSFCPHNEHPFCRLRADRDYALKWLKEESYER